MRRTIVVDHSFVNAESPVIRGDSKDRVFERVFNKKTDEMPTSMDFKWRITNMRSSTGGTAEACNERQKGDTASVADKKTFKVVFIVDVEIKRLRSQHNAVRTKGAVLGKLLLSPNKYWRKYYDTHEGTSTP